MSRQVLTERHSMTTGRVLVVDDHVQARESVSDVLRSAGHHVDACSSAVEATQVLARESYDLVITDLQMPGMSGLEFIQHIERAKLGVQVVMITAHATVSSAVAAMRHGAFDYIEKPFNVDQLEQVAERAIAHGRIVDAHVPLSVGLGGAGSAMIGSSAAMQSLRRRIAQIAPTVETVLISGESGTGKELVARSLHEASTRAAAPLVSLNCPVLSEQLMESELFGHERGAFTGADAARTGRFELAHGGTILLDEITEIELPLQAKLLRVLQEKTLERVGSSRTIHVDVRVLATTNRNLRGEVAAGTFREDLYYRLAVVPIEVPPLRERPTDIPELVQYFLARAGERLGKQPCQMEAAASDLLAGYFWPGNVRELENIVTRASVLNEGRPVTADELRPWLLDAEGSASDSLASSAAPAVSLEVMERKLIESTLQRFGGHRAQTAHALGIGIRTLSGKLKSYGYGPRTKHFAAAG